MRNYILILPLLISLLFIYSFRHLADKYTIAKRNREPSRIGGLAFYLAFSLSLIINQIFGIIPLKTNFFLGIILCSGLMVFFGLVDDFRELPIFIKLSVQILVAFLLTLFDIKLRIPLFPPYVNAILTVLWIITVVNAFNLLDILDGLAGGIALITGVTFFLLSVLFMNVEIGLISLMFCAVIIPFLILNRKPAKIFMGDNGSMFLGLILAIIAIRMSHTPLKGSVAFLAPLLALGLPLFDITFVSLLRIIKGKSPLLKSRDHFSLRLLSLGYSQELTTLFMYTLCIFFCLLAILSSKLSELHILLLLIFTFVMMSLISRKIALVKV